MDDLAIAPEPFDAPDSLALREAMLAELVEMYGSDDEPGTKPSAGDISVFLVARRAGRAVGCGALRALGDGAYELKRMFTVPDARGTGVGSAVLTALETEAHALGASTMRLETGPVQVAALQLYERSGYARVPCWGAYARNPRSLCLAKALHPA